MALLTRAAERRRAEEERAEFKVEFQLPLGVYGSRRWTAKRR